MDWTAGYASDVEYVAGFYREQSPAFLNFVTLLHGYEPIPLDRPFNYFELGFGRGLTLNALAAAHPNGQFFGADFNPAHVAGARELAGKAGLKNIVLMEDSFEDLAAGQRADLPQFDFITLHGIYTWVTTENQGYIVEFLRKYLKPGGVVYLSYNAMPGWAPSLPIQRILTEYGDAHPKRSDLQVREAIDLITRMFDQKATFFLANPGLEARLNSMKGASINYLVHEYMHKHWAPKYHADVARELGAAKLDFVGSADVVLAYPQLYLTPEKNEVIATMSSSAVRETMKDYYLNTAFRKDVFVRGARKMSAARVGIALENVVLSLVVPRAKATSSLKVSFGTVSGKEDIYSAVFDALTEKSRTLGQLRALPALQHTSIADMAQTAAMLVATNQAEVSFPANVDASPDKARQLNRAIAEMTVYGDEMAFLVSPLTGNGMSTGFIERLVYHVLPAGVDRADLKQVVGAVWAVFKAQGRAMVHEGKAAEGEAANLALLEPQVAQILEQRLPIWRRLKMI